MKSTLMYIDLSAINAILIYLLIGVNLSLNSGINQEYFNQGKENKNYTIIYISKHKGEDL